MDSDPLPVADAVLCQLPLVFATAQIVALSIAVFFLFISGFVSGSEIAFFSIDPEDEELDDTPEGEAVRKLLKSPERLLATILISNNLVNVTIVVLTNFALGPLFEGMGEVWSFVLQTVILTFLILLFGEIFPKLYSKSNPMGWAKFAVKPLSALESLFYPLSSMLVKSTGIVNRVVTKKADNLSTDDLSKALEITDVSSGDERKMLKEILRFGDTTASEIMTPRVDITGIDAESDFNDVMHTIIESGYARIPCYEKTLYDINGILYSLDLLP
ncbi:MAG: CNNM domain-containing protein, partial [Muribaculaceae bacterium]|nr:CNNM domain-containing protein [Muribaculaceae bacterium]